MKVIRHLEVEHLQVSKSNIGDARQGSFTTLKVRSRVMNAPSKVSRHLAEGVHVGCSEVSRHLEDGHGGENRARCVEKVPHHLEGVASGSAKVRTDMSEGPPPP